MSVSSSGEPLVSGLASSQSICAFLNRFEKDLEGDVVDANIEEVIACELDATESRETPLSTRSQTSRYSEKFKNFLRERSLPDDIETMPDNKLNLYLRTFITS